MLRLYGSRRRSDSLVVGDLRRQEADPSQDAASDSKSSKQRPDATRAASELKGIDESIEHRCAGGPSRQ